MIQRHGPLFEEAGGGSGSGGSAGSLLTGDAGSQQKAPATQQSAALLPDPSKWRDFLADDFKVDPAFKDYKDLNSLAKSHKSLQKMLGSDKIPAPKDDWAPEQWSEFYERLGRPKTADEYEFKKPENYPGDDEFIKDVVKTMHEAGLTKKQVASVLETYMSKDMARLTAHQSEQQKATAAAITGLQKEYGEKFNENVNYARYATKELGDADTIKLLDETGLTNNPALFRMMAKAGRLLAGDRASGANTGGVDALNLTQAEAAAAISSLTSDREYMAALFDANHREHDAAVQKRMRLFQIAYPQLPAR
jgi:hypothetical protein